MLQKRIAQAGVPDEPGKVNLLALFTKWGNVVKGKPKLENGVLSADSMKNLLIEFPYVPPAEYDYAVEFTAPNSGELLQIQVGGGKQFSWRMGAFDGQWCYFEALDSGKYGRFGDRFNKRWLTGGEHYVSVVKVRKDGVQAFLNGKEVTSHKTDYRGVSLLGELKLSRADTLGLEFPPGMEVDAVSVTEVTGSGRVLRGN